jgi:hypothetical protein
MMPSPQSAEQSPFGYLGIIYPPQSQVTGQVKHRPFILKYPVEHIEQNVKFTHDWHPKIGQVEH